MKHPSGLVSASAQCKLFLLVEHCKAFRLAVSFAMPCDKDDPRALFMLMSQGLSWIPERQGHDATFVAFWQKACHVQHM